MALFSGNMVNMMILIVFIHNIRYDLFLFLLLLHRDVRESLRLEAFLRRLRVTLSRYSRDVSLHLSI